jgi:hypothetical protein
MRFSPTFAATLLILAALTPTHAETVTPPEALAPALEAYIEASATCVAEDEEPINALHFPMQVTPPDQTQPADEPAAATPPAQQPVPASP